MSATDKIPPAWADAHSHMWPYRDGRGRRETLTAWPSVLLLLALVLQLAAPAHAAFVNFQNCLSPQMISGLPPPLRLQFDPLSVTAKLNLTDPGHELNITIYGNVSGQATEGQLPPSTDTKYWSDVNQTMGKIVDLDPATTIYSTLFPQLSVLNFNNYNSKGQRFCGALVGTNASCPLAPVFEDVQDPVSSLPAITFSHPLEATYGFTTITAVFNAEQGDQAKSPLACIQVDVTPYLGETPQALLTYLPLIILVLVAISTTCAALFSPWGTWDIFRATSNYGREVRLLRLMTPGFGDCLNYLQFIVLTGSLSLNYPGFFQPAVSNVAWSALMFNESFVTRGPGNPSTVDGIYVANGTFGLDVMSQLVGMHDMQDLWAGTVIWLLVVIAAVVLLIQIAFLFRWLYRFISKTQQEDLRAKNMPFSVGNTIRIVFNYFLLPVVTASMFQLAIAGSTPTLATPIMAAVTILVLILFAAWLGWIILNARPRSFLFDDLLTVLLYGPLYNTYSDSAAPFALVTIITTLLRGIAIGAVQSSGIAQIVLLAIGEVIFMLTLSAFRPFFSGTYMNLINTVFSVTRLIIVLMMVVFVPSLELDDTSKGYVGYVILLLHGLVLFAGFFLRLVSTLLEIAARAAGAGEDSSAIGNFARVLGLRQLSRRNARDAAQSRGSYASNAAMINDRARHLPSEQRSRSMSASSGLLLNQTGRHSVALESVSYAGSGPFGSAAGGTAGPASQPQSGILANLRGETADPYFRPPRPRRTTVETRTSERQGSGSMGSGDWANLRNADAGQGTGDLGEGLPPDTPGRDQQDSFDERRPKPDYATREVDYYYGVRGPALSHMPTRRLKTGPADPTGPVSSATGWFMGLFGGKSKDKNKGFEVVRSSRMPAQMEMEEGSVRNSAARPYVDDAESPTAVRPRHFELDDEGDAVGGGTRHIPGENRDIERGRPLDNASAPHLPDIDTGSSIHMPSRWNSRTSGALPVRRSSLRDSSDEDTEDDLGIPRLPRKSSRRTPSQGGSKEASAENLARLSTDSVTRLSTVPGSPPESPEHRAGSQSNAPGTFLMASVTGSPTSPRQTRPGSQSTAPGTFLVTGPSSSAVSNRDSGATATSSVAAARQHRPITPQRLPFGNIPEPIEDGRQEREASIGSLVSSVSEDVSRTSDVSALSRPRTEARSSGRRGDRRSGGGGSTGGSWNSTAMHATRNVTQNYFEGGRGRGDANALTPGARGGPSTGMGYVHAHHTSESIHLASPSQTSLTGSAAEVVDEDEPASNSMGRRR